MIEYCHRDFYGIILTIINTINHLLILLVTGYLLTLSGFELEVLNIHVGLCVVGYVLLMSEAIMVLSEENVWSSIVPRRACNHVHWYLQCLGTSFIIGGIVVLFKSRDTHFRSIHGILGISSAVILCFLSLSGFTVLFAVKLNAIIRPIVSKCIHNVLGITCYILGMISLCYGYKKKWIIRNAGPELANSCTVLTGIIISITIMRPVRSLVNQIKSILY